jgi:hypothetical protein
MTVLPGASRFDIMTYCNQPQWLSAYAYEGIRARLNAENPAGTGAPAGDAGALGMASSPVFREIAFSRGRTVLAGPEQTQMQVQEGHQVSIVATLNLTRQTGKILYVNHVKRALVSGAIQDSPAKIVVRGRDLNVLGTFPAVIKQDTDIPEGEDKTAAAVIELVLNGKTVDQLKIPAHPPEVKPGKPLVRTDRGGLLAEWQGYHPEGARLTYLVQISPDGLKDWQTIGVGQTEPRITITPEQLKKAPNGVLRVVANDGYNESTPLILQLASAPYQPGLERNHQLRFVVEPPANDKMWVSYSVVRFEKVGECVYSAAPSPTTAWPVKRTLAKGGGKGIGPLFNPGLALPDGKFDMTGHDDGFNTLFYRSEGGAGAKTIVCRGTILANGKDVTLEAPGRTSSKTYTAVSNLGPMTVKVKLDPAKLSVFTKERP